MQALPLQWYTYEDYLKIEDDLRREIINGMIYMMSAPNREHQRLLGEIFSRLHNHFRGNPCQVYLAPFDVRIPVFGEEVNKSSNVVQPDISVYCEERKLDAAGGIAAPDLVVEILSPSSRAMDNYRKRDLYEKNGVKEYWIVDPESRQICVLRLKGNRFDDALLFAADDTITTPLFPGLCIDLAEIFPDA